MPFLTIRNLIHSHVEALLASRPLPRSKTILHSCPRPFIWCIRSYPLHLYVKKHVIQNRNRRLWPIWRSSVFIVYAAESLRCRHSKGGSFGSTLPVAFCNLSYNVRPPPPPPLPLRLCTQPLETLIKSSLHYPTPTQPFLLPRQAIRLQG
jgi:hypothetical protein